jgi:hypothetical protein
MPVKGGAARSGAGHESRASTDASDGVSLGAQARAAVRHLAVVDSGA